MDMRINQLTGQAPVEQQTQAPKGDDSFKFTLVSHIENNELQEKLSSLMKDIEEQGNNIQQHSPDIIYCIQYCQIILFFFQ